MDHVRCPASGKVAYGTRAEATRAKRRRDHVDIMSGRAPHQNLHVYECPDCRLWHVGHDGRVPRRGTNPCRE